MNYELRRKALKRLADWTLGIICWACFAIPLLVVLFG
jgi:hypothetical protein